LRGVQGKGISPACPALDDNTKAPVCNSVSADGVILKAKSCYLISSLEQVQMEILSRGPVSAGIMVFEDLLHYETGVYTVQTGQIVSLFPFPLSLSLSFSLSLSLCLSLWCL
jgi:hypothetical protein